VGLAPARLALGRADLECQRTGSALAVAVTRRHVDHNVFHERWPEFGSRYALAKASGIPVTTLQNYATGSRPGIDTLTTLARVANVDATWLLTGRGQMRGDGQQSGALLADVLLVDQHDPNASLIHPTILNQLPFSRHYLERTLGISEPTWQSLLAIAAPAELFDIT